jgi:hypothetical protein
LLDTVPAVAVKFAVVAPAGTVTDAGTGSAALFEESPTDVPPAAAACDNVTVHVEVPPDTTELGKHCSPLTVVVTVPPPEVTGLFMSVTISAAESARL